MNSVALICVFYATLGRVTTVRFENLWNIDWFSNFTFIVFGFLFDSTFIFRSLLLPNPRVAISVSVIPKSGLNGINGKTRD